MTDTHANESAAGGSRGESAGSRSLRPADWLCLAATPTFAVMALLSAVLGGGADMLCLTAQGASPLTGMVAMYLLMGAFHSGPWLNLFAGARSDAHRNG